MGATAFEYRYRYLLHTALYILGFAAPWNFWLRLDPEGPNAHAWGLLAANLAQLGVVSFAVAFQGLLLLAVACAALGAFLRSWGIGLSGDRCGAVRGDVHGGERRDAGHH